MQSSARATWDPMLLPLAEFVEAERGLEFSRPVALTRFEASDAFGPIPERAFPARRTVATRLLGQRFPDLTLFSEVPDAYVQFAGTLFTPAPAQIRLSDAFTDAAAAPTLVHELVHALHFQNGMTPVADIDSRSDEFFFYRALSEGDADRIQNAYIEQLTEQQRQQYLDELGIPLGNTRDPSWEPVHYTIGEPLVRALFATGGQEQLDILLRSAAGFTPSSTVTLIDLFSDGTQAVDALQLIELPAGVIEADSEIGAYGWFFTLAPLVGTADAFDLLMDYEADAYAVFEDNSCVRYALFFTADAGVTTFAETLAGLGVEATQDQEDRSVTFDLCEPLRDPELQTSAVAMPLIVAQQVLNYHLERGESIDVARCASMAQARTVPFDLPLEDFAGYDSFFEASAPFLESCE